MATSAPSLGSRVYVAISLVLLTSWSISTLGFTVLNILNDNSSLLAIVGSVSLLMFLTCRLVVLLQSNAQNDSIAHFLTTTHTRSRKEAAVMLICTFTWLYELSYQFFFMLFATVFGGAIATAIYNDAFEVNEVNDLEPSKSDIENTSLAEIEEFKAKAGVDPRMIFNWIPPKALVYLALLLWLNFWTLCLYVLRQTWRSARAVLGASSSSNEAVQKKEE